MEFTILGRTRLRIDGRLVDLGAAKQRAVLTLLLLNVNRLVSLDLIVEQLWRDRSRSQVQGNLQSMISRLRAILRRAGVPYDLPRELDGYRLMLNPQLIDYYRFRRQVDLAQDSARQGDHVTARRLLLAAVTKWQGPALADLRTDWAENRRRQLTETDLLPAYYALFDSELELREFADVLREIRPLMDEHPYDETLARQAILALAGAGRHNEAANLFLQFRQHCVAELGTEPTDELVNTFQRVLRNRGPTAPAAADTPDPPQRLPREPPYFTGRQDLLDAIDARLPPTGQIPPRVIALQGMPGVGKTTLGVHWARRHLDRFQDGQLYIDLGGFSRGDPVSAEDAMSRLLYDLGVPADLIPARIEQRSAKLSRLLSSGMLLFLDNVRGSAHARPLLEAASSCFVIVTSRTRLTGLAIRGGVDYLAVQPLSADDSVALLRAEVGSERADQDPRAVQELAMLTGGLSLAVRIVGHYVAHHPHTALADIARELDNYPALIKLTDDDEDAATLPGAFSLSYDALPPDAACLFRRLGLHPTRQLSLPAAAALLAADHATTQAHLKALTAMHLIEQESLSVYRMHDLVHAYAADQAWHEEPEQAEEAIHRMIDWYVRSALNAQQTLAPHSSPVPPPPSITPVTPMSFDDDQQAIRWCDQERANLIACIRCAAEHGLHEYVWRAAASLWEAFERSGFKDDFLRVLPVAIESARALGDGTAESGMLNSLGRVHFLRRNYQQALGYFQEGLEVAVRAEDSIWTAASRHNVACALLELGQFETALQLYEQTLQHHATGELHGKAYTLHRIGDVHQRRDATGLAIEYYREALEIRRRVGHLRGESDTLTELGRVYHGLRQYDLAVDYCSRALTLQERAHDKVKATDILTTLATIHYDGQNYFESIQHARQAITLTQSTKDSLARAKALEVLGRSLLATGDQDGARTSWQGSLSIFEALADPLAAVAIREGLERIPDPRQ